MEPYQFEDVKGETWDLKLTVGRINAVRSETSVNLWKADTGEPLQKMSDDAEVLVNVISVILSTQINTRALSAEEFAERLGGDTLEAATDALWQAILLMFPKKRAALEALYQKAGQIQEKEVELVVERINSPAMDNFLNKKLKDAEKKFDKKLEEQ